MLPCGRCCGVAFCAGVFFCSSIARRQRTHSFLRNFHPSCHRRIPQRSPTPGTSGESHPSGCIGGGTRALSKPSGDARIFLTRRDGRLIESRIGKRRTPRHRGHHCLLGGVQLPVPKSRDSLSSFEPEVGLQPNIFRRRSFLPVARLLCKGMLCVPSS